MVTNQVLHVNVPTSIGHLEGILKPEAEGTAPKFVSVICHPHPLGGGTMHNKVVFKVAQALQMQNIPALRFNFRGVGHSSGTYDDGRGEMDDVYYALEFYEPSPSRCSCYLSGILFWFLCWFTGGVR